MLIVYILLILLFSLTAHLFILPLSKRRPVFIKGIEGSLLFLAFFFILAVLTHPFIYILAVAIGVLIYYTKSWIVYGVSLENIASALDRAVLATRASCVKSNQNYEIDNNMTVRITNIGKKICYIRYTNKSYSRKSELTKEIFRKFIQNYFI